MKARLFISAAIAATLLAACSNDDSTQQPADAARTAANFTAQISTRAAGDQWEAGDAIGIYMLKTGTATIAEGTQNHKYVTATATGKFAPADEGQTVYFPVDETDKVDFKAYYPYAALTGNTCTVDLSDQTHPAAIDLMCSDNMTARNKLEPTVELEFRHRLSRIEIKVLAGDGFTADNLKGLSITLGKQPCTATYNVVTNELSASTTDTKTLTLLTAENGQSSSAILMPQGGAKERVLTFVMKDGNKFAYNLKDNKTFEEGKATLYTITLSLTGVEVSDATILPWDSQGDVTDDAEIE
ncbi:fimbrillin family protein [Phocaeicola sp.]